MMEKEVPDDEKLGDLRAFLLIGAICWAFVMAYSLLLGLGSIQPFWGNIGLMVLTPVGAIVVVKSVVMYRLHNGSSAHAIFARHRAGWVVAGTFVSLATAGHLAGAMMPTAEMQTWFVYGPFVAVLVCLVFAVLFWGAASKNNVQKGR